MDLLAISDFLGTWGYPALLALLVLTGVGSPIPEDLLLLTAGYLIFAGLFWWPLALAVSVMGVVASDLILYSAGRHIAWRPPRTMERRLLEPARLRHVGRWFDRLGPAVILVARLLPGTRALTFVTAGVRGIPASRFLRFDVCGALLWVPLLLVAGHSLGEQVGDLEDLLRSLQQGAAWVAVLGLALLAAWLVWGPEESKL
jgi:membrane protein DedA with SNARE-associated domain